MSKNFIEAYKDSISRSVEYFAHEFFDETELGFIFDVEEDSISYVDGLYLKDEIQILYFFSDKKIRMISLVIENNRKVINTKSIDAENIRNVSLKQIANEDVILTIELLNDREIILDNNNIFQSWKRKASEVIKEIYKKYY